MPVSLDQKFDVKLRASNSNVHFVLREPPSSPLRPTWPVTSYQDHVTSGQPANRLSGVREQVMGGGQLVNLIGSHQNFHQQWTSCAHIHGLHVTHFTSFSPLFMMFALEMCDFLFFMTGHPDNLCYGLQKIDCLCEKWRFLKNNKKN